MSAAVLVSTQIEALPACLALGVARATFYRYRSNVDGSQTRLLERPSPARSLSSLERKTVLDLLTSERFADDPPRQIWAALLDEGKYFCSVSTMYRILRAECGVRERRDQLRHPVYSKPELLATSPNQVWSWDGWSLVNHNDARYYLRPVALALDSFEAHLSLSICPRRGTDMPDTLQSVIIGAVSGVLSAVVTYYSTRAKSRLDLTVARDTELHNARLTQYKLLWPMLKPIARYGRENAVTHAVLTEVSNRTRDWYFAEGGLYLTAASRTPYFRWKKHMQELLDDVHLQEHQNQPIPEKDLQSMVKAIGDLHASLSEDLDTRRKSLF